MELLCYIDFEIKQCQLYYVWPLRKKGGYDECYGVAETEQREVTLQLTEMQGKIYSKFWKIRTNHHF